MSWVKINILILATNEAAKDNTLEVTIQNVKILEQQTYLDYCQQNLKHLNYRLIFLMLAPPVEYFDQRIFRFRFKKNLFSYPKTLSILSRLEICIKFKIVKTNRIALFIISHFI